MIRDAKQPLRLGPARRLGFCLLLVSYTASKRLENILIRGRTGAGDVGIHAELFLRVQAQVKAAQASAISGRPLGQPRDAN